jgi:methyl-accepting chemotaxis protein
MKKFFNNIIRFIKGDSYRELNQKYDALSKKMLEIQMCVNQLSTTSLNQSEALSSLASSYHEIIKALYDYSLEDEQAAVTQIMMLPEIDDDEFLN